MLEEIQIKNHSNEMMAMLKNIRTSELINSGNSVKDLKALSLMISKINEKSTLDQLRFLVRGLGYIRFELHVLNPLDSYLKTYNQNSVTKICLKPKMAKTILETAKNELDEILKKLSQGLLVN